ncbi:response regulator transcription factor [Hephaestia sp. GCM10023244]|uniref:response regulator transcription factor n=1 Tax=unclassified Hephaestia TaxID=2631281 RepID=UPI00207746FD|nr:helix-turn-helix transcriptional regulator [Hephaestia sp. MAHUQ-44]MCM8732402.1 helix-turn-helix transcriptional regulator [Hephaestia sp. MAHUQ-44]
MRIDLLSAREKECLHLLLHPMRAKEIARVTGLSVHTVHDHLKSARRKLGTGDSLTAAKILRDHEGGHPQNLGSTESGWRADNGDGHDVEVEVETIGLAVLPFAQRGRPWNDLSLRWRIMWPLLLLVGLAIGAGVLVAGASALTQIALQLSG